MRSHLDSISQPTTVLRVDCSQFRTFFFSVTIQRVVDGPPSWFFKASAETRNQDGGPLNSASDCDNNRGK